MNGAESSADEASFPGFIPVRLPIDVTAARHFLEAEYFNFDSENVRVLQANNGMSNPTYLLFWSAAAPLAKDHYQEKAMSSFCPGHIRLIEFRVMKALQDTRVPVPRVHALCEDEKVLGQSFYVMDFCEGRVLDQEEVMALSPRERHRVR